ncbi:energy transducer TonB [Peristeroidobacter agariperforans]|uniref:energy transducer TonB n=1 Tax=Peristeroidobacter agariperforans TaxID=268404 RepID=UPI00130018A5|nr:energy transducer TonB [Peristeroidobacter agariperforans]
MTVNSFPSMHNWNSPRAWALAIIVLLHLGFFWALTNGMTQKITKIFVPQAPVLLPQPQQPQPPKPVDIKDARIDVKELTPTYTLPPIDVFTEPSDRAPIVDPIPTPPNSFVDEGGGVAPPVPMVVEPRIDARRGLSEPYYPPDVIRGGGEGTVVLSIYILADGRVGDVRLISSSGIAKLDQSAMREAKKWRFVPGTSDGKPMAMWKQLPVTFRLNTRM